MTMIKYDRLATGSLAALRVMSGLVFLSHGLIKLIGFPQGAGNGVQPLSSLLGIGGMLETFGGTLMILGLFTRPVAFILSGEMAVAYFLFHAKRSFYPGLNGGEEAILFTFLFLYFSVCGAGAMSIDAWLGGRSNKRSNGTSPS